MQVGDKVTEGVVDAVAGETAVFAVVFVAVGRPAERLDGEVPAGVHDQVSGGPVEAHDAERRARVTPVETHAALVLVVAVGVHDGPRAVGEAEEHLPAVFALDDGVEAVELRVDALDVAEEKPKGVDEMDPGLVDQQPRIVAEKGLAVQVGVLPPTVAHAHLEIGEGDRADGAPVHDLLDLPVPGLPAPVVVDHEGNVVRLGQRHQLPARIHRGRQRLLADHGDVPPGGETHDLRVCGRRAQNIDEIRLFGGDHFPEIAVAVGNAVGPRLGLGPRAVEVAQRRDNDFGDAAPGLQMERAEVAGADADTFQGSCVGH